RISYKKADRLEQESLEFHKKVRKGFFEIAKIEKNRYIIIDGRDSVEKIHKEIVKMFEEKIRKVKNETK
ncbi:MAG: hypothetical protein KAU01_07130, partial [Candidatus Cloacimonetes bacterium]|nr:hypothetical protein [Candidatus Cloacimonadota bacterium]